MHNSVNVRLNPELKAHVLDGSILRYTCESCGKSAPAMYDLLYHDPSQALMIQLTGHDPQQMAEILDDALDATNERIPWQLYTRRITRTPPELFEKVRIFDAGLDDSMVEVVKGMIALEVDDLEADDLYFFELQGEVDDADSEMAFVGFVDGEAFTYEVKKESYDVAAEVRPTLAETTKTADSWLVVDQAYLVKHAS